MNVLEIPFHKYIGLQKADPESGFIYKLEEKQEYLNHLGTIHAGALYILAEATSGQYLIDTFKEYKSDVIPVLRKSEVKYSKPGIGKIYSKANLYNVTALEIVNQLRTKKRVLVSVNIELYVENGQKIMMSVFEWFFTLRTE